LERFMRLARHFIALLLSSLLPGLAAAGPNVLSLGGYGKIRFGTTLAVAEAELMEHATPKTREPGCDFVRFKKYPGIRFMVEDGVVTRADAGKRIANSAGVKEGMPLARVLAMHPRMEIEPHKYDDTGHYLILRSPDKSSAFVFEEGGGKITGIRAGIQPSVEYVEGCS
jgi:hypothetical protein